MQLLQDNDSSFVECDLTGNATYSMKCIHFTKEIALALRTNTHLKKLTLSSLGISDSGVQQLAEALRENKALSYLNLSKNSFGSDGLVSLMDALIVNSTLLEIDLMGQTKPFGDSALAKVIAMFNHNITLKHISWRLQSRQSFAINKLIVRNIEISKRLASGKSILDILPEPRRAEFGGDSAPVIEDSVGKLHMHSEPSVQHPHHEAPAQHPHHEETHQHQAQAQTHAQPKIEIVTPAAAPAETKPKPQPQPQPAKPTQTAQPAKPAATGKMLNRYLQAAQGTTDGSSPSSPAPSKNFPTNSSSKRSFFEKQIEEQSIGAAKLNTRPQPIQRVTTHNPKASPPMVEQPVEIHQTHQQEQQQLDKPKHSTSRVASIWKDKFENSNANNTQAAPEKNLISPRNKVQEMWSPRTETVKKTEVEVVQNGASKVASVWKNILEEEEKKLQDASSKVPAGKREANQKQEAPQSTEEAPQPKEEALQPKEEAPEVKQEEDVFSFKVEVQQVEPQVEVHHTHADTHHPDVDQSILIKYPSIGNLDIEGPLVFNLDQPENVVTIEIPSSD
uniref:Uncharacterized protein n=1 Tax=Arcella intermedia TaxID=1963864 RepID=A0A6B2L0T8_9EUKA